MEIFIQLTQPTILSGCLTSRSEIAMNNKQQYPLFQNLEILKKQMTNTCKRTKKKTQSPLPQKDHCEPITHQSAMKDG